LLAGSRVAALQLKLARSSEAFRGRWEDAQLSAESRRKKGGKTAGKSLSAYDKKLKNAGKLAGKATPRG
jgi:hypothetical protein